MSAAACRVCGCTEDDCMQCIAKTGAPCCWTDAGCTLCSACLPGVHLRASLDAVVARGACTPEEAATAFRFMDELSDQELRGEISPEDALRRVASFGIWQLLARSAT